MTFILSEWSFFNICVLSQCIVYWINFQNIYKLLRIKKHYLIQFYCSFLKFSKAFTVSLSNYADNVIIYSVGENHKTNRNILNIIFLFLQKWFYHKYTVLNTGKCCYMSFSFNPDKSDLILKVSTIIPSAEEYVVLGVTIDNRLTFYNHLKNLCKK